MLAKTYVEKEGVQEVSGDFVVPDSRWQSAGFIHASNRSAEQTPSRDGWAAGALDFYSVEEQIAHLDRRENRRGLFKKIFEPGAHSSDHHRTVLRFWRQNHAL